MLSILHPQSCFSIFFVNDLDNYILPETTTINFNIYSKAGDFELTGFWTDMNLTFETDFDYMHKPDPLSSIITKQITLTVFVSDKSLTLPLFLDQHPSSLIGMLPCPESLQKYSAAYQLLKDTPSNGRINSMRWNIETNDNNTLIS